MKVWLTADVTQICQLNFRVAPEILGEFVPEPFRLSLFEGSPYLSLVGAQLEPVLIQGHPHPRPQPIAVISLRTLVDYGNSTGMLNLASTFEGGLSHWIARRYVGHPLRDLGVEVEVERGEGVKVAYRIPSLEGTPHFSLRGRDPPLMAPPGSPEDTFKEVPWFFFLDADGIPRYQAYEHGTWFVHPLTAFQFEFNLGAVFGEDFARLEPLEAPTSAILSVGSRCHFHEPEYFA